MIVGLQFPGKPGAETGFPTFPAWHGADARTFFPW